MDINSENTVVYTILIGQNEGLNPQSQIKNSKLRHVCLTDNENLKSDDWEIIYVERLLPMDQYRSQRNLKIRPHLIFPEYKYSFYMDNTVSLKTKVEDFISNIFLTNIEDEKAPHFILPFHSFRDNLIDEFYECFSHNLDSDIRFFEQITDYLLINKKALKFKPYWTAMLFRNHMDPLVKEFSEIWFSNILRYSRRDQLSIIHSQLQSKLKIVGFYLDNFKSDYHMWPVAKNERIFRGALNNIYKLPPDIFQDINADLSLKDEEINKINYEKKIKDLFLKFEKSYKEFENLEEEKRNLEEEKRNLEEDKRKLYSEINNIKNSRIWRYSAFYRKIMDQMK